MTNLRVVARAVSSVSSISSGTDGADWSDRRRVSHHQTCEAVRWRVFRIRRYAGVGGHDIGTRIRRDSAAWRRGGRPIAVEVGKVISRKAGIDKNSSTYAMV